MIIKLNAEESIDTNNIVYLKKHILENWNGPNKLILRITTKTGSEIDILHEPPFVDVYNLERKIVKTVFES